MTDHSKRVYEKLSKLYSLQNQVQDNFISLTKNINSNIQ